MKKYILSLFVTFTLGNELLSQIPSGYCNSSVARSTAEEIVHVELKDIDNETTCISLVGTQGIGTGTAGQYADYTNTTVPVPVIVPGETGVDIDITIENCGGSNVWGGDRCKAWIDFNRDADFNDPGEEIFDKTTAGTAWMSNISTEVLSDQFDVPINIGDGETKLRIKFRDNGVPQPCGTPAWSDGEVEDYVVLLGKKRWDYEILSVTEPDSISFCADKPVDMKISFKNVGNQPVIGGRVDAHFKGIGTSTTNIHEFGIFTNSVLVKKSSIVEIQNIIFPADEILEATFIIKNELDSNAGNDTLRRFIQIYKTPTYNLDATTVCRGDSTVVTISNLSKPAFIKWSNQSLNNTTKYLLTNTTNIPIEISRGWKCTVNDNIQAIVNQLPNLEVSDDTVLCFGQSVTISATGSGANYAWNDDNGTLNATITVADTTRCYTVTTTDFNLCSSVDSVCIKAVRPLTRQLVMDTICSGDFANIGMSVSDYSDYLFEWVGRTETTPLIQPQLTSSVQNIQNYQFDWYYKGCRTRESVNVLINPTPTVNVSTNDQGICKGFSATLTASGASSYAWDNSSSNPSITVSPQVSTKYEVVGTDPNGCTDVETFTQVVHADPDVVVYSNKFNNNVCLGDSVIIFSSGARIYSWSDGFSDSVQRLMPTQSMDFTVTGTDHNGCKDTAEYRLSVKPAIPDVVVTGGRGCEGDQVTLVATSSASGITYKWSDDSVSNTYTVTLSNTTQYPVSITSADECQVVDFAKVEVLPKPIPKVHDVTICAGETAQLEASGGSSYVWSSNNTGRVVNRQVGQTTVDTVWVYNEVGCYDSAYATIHVRPTADITFKSPVKEYVCPNVPVTMVATPYGGFWDDSTTIWAAPDSLSSSSKQIDIENNLFHAEKLRHGMYGIKYTYLDPINGCKSVKYDTVYVRRYDFEYDTMYDTTYRDSLTTGGVIISVVDSLSVDSTWKIDSTKICYGSTSSITSTQTQNKGLTLFPNPFDNSLNLSFKSTVRENAYIRIYDLAGREVYYRDILIRAGLNEILLDDIEISKGSYILELMRENQSIQEQLIKN